MRYDTRQPTGRSRWSVAAIAVAIAATADAIVLAAADAIVLAAAIMKGEAGITAIARGGYHRRQGTLGGSVAGQG